jgi:DNA invertase Pin-like site-specific DNA recombinase
MKKKDRLLRLLSVCRVSSREQSEGYSLEAQDQANREWAERKGYEIVQTVRYVETASKQKERQRFREIINRICSDPTINGVVFHKVDRACRNLTDLALLERLETQKDKKVFFASQEFPQNAAGRLGIGVMGVVARWYTDNLKEEINKGFRSKVEAGEYPHIPPYGYCMGHGSNGNKLPVPEPAKAETVRIIFKLMSSGKYTIDTLRDELFQRGRYFSPKTQRWTRSHLAKLLRHPFYIGKIRWRGRIYEGKHEALVNEQTWERVQQILDGRNRSSRYKRRRFTYGHGLIKCAHCGYSITGELHKQCYTYYRCAQINHHEHPVRRSWVPESVIESQIISMLDRLILPSEIYDWAMAYLTHVFEKEVDDAEQELRKLKKRNADVQATLDTLLLKAAQTEDNLAEEFLRIARQKQKELKVLQQRATQIEAGQQEDNGDAAKILELAQRLPEQYLTFTPPQKRQVVDSVFLNLRLDTVNLCGDYRLPFSILADNHTRPLKSGRQDLNLRPLR